MAKTGFSRLLLKWNCDSNHRQMPWKGEKDPYRIWLSEIILQQTRVEQGLKYYDNFIKSFPNIHKLAKASESKVMKFWEGLGYYSRCRNLLITARFISKELKGRFPDNYDSIKMLKGVGPYTAAAISSFAFNLPYPVIDGNVFRVLSRVFGINKAIDSAEGKKIFNSLAWELLDKKEPGKYNQAIMDFGALICKPIAPLCRECTFRKKCSAFLHNTTDMLPVKKKQIKIRERWFYYIVFNYKTRIALCQRKEKDIWQGLFEFPLFEMKKEMRPSQVLKQAIHEHGLAGISYKEKFISTLHTQKLSHQLIKSYFLFIKISRKPKHTNEWIWVSKNELTKYAFPVLINKFLGGYKIQSF